MKRSKFTESQIVFAIKQSDSGTRVSEVCLRGGIPEGSFYNWKKKYKGRSFRTTSLKAYKEAINN